MNNTMTSLEKAILIAARAHEGQKDKAGKPYLLHSLAVMMEMTCESEMVAAVLHDVVEDSDWSLDDLRKEGVSTDIIDAVDCLTHREAESYDAYIERVRSNSIARKIKLADLKENMDLRRIKSLTDSDLKRAEKYHKAWNRLTEN